MLTIAGIVPCKQSCTASETATACTQCYFWELWTSHRLFRVSCMHLAPPWSAEKEGCFTQDKSIKETNGIEFLSPVGWVSWRYTQTLSQWLLRLASVAGLPGCHLLSECEQSVFFPVISKSGFLPTDLKIKTLQLSKEISFFSYECHYWDISSNFSSVSKHLKRAR